MAALVASPAAAFHANVGWTPVQSIAGYRLYVRQSGQKYSGGVDVGFVQAGVDGVVHYVTHGVPNGVTNYFAVTTYDASGRESALSNELSLLVIATPTAIPTPSASATASRTPTATASASRTPPVSATATRTPTVTRTRTSTSTLTPTPTATPSPTCAPGTCSGIRGQIYYYADGEPVPDTTLTLQGTRSSVAGRTDGLGQYAFAGVPGGTWQLTPQKQGDLSGVSALDAAYVLQVVSGMRTFDAFQTLACDVTGNGTLSALDASRILQLTVGEIDRFPVAETCGSDWVFVPQPMQQIVSPQISGTSCQNGAIEFGPLPGIATNQNFTAALFGDCTGNWSAPASGAALRLVARPPRAWLGLPRMRSGGRWAVSLYVDRRDDVRALEAHVGYDPAGAVLEAVHVARAPGALVRSRADSSGLVTIALASAEPLTAGRRLVVLVFAGAAAPQVHLLDAVVDDLRAQVAETATASALSQDQSPKGEATAARPSW